MKKIIPLICLFCLIGCFPHKTLIKYSCLQNDIPDGVYTWSDLSFLYWGYNIKLTVKEGRGIAKIKDVRSSFEAEDILTYQKSGYNDCNDLFGGKYLSFIKQNDVEWIIILRNPVSGIEFIGITKIWNRT